MARYIDADALGIGYANPKVFNSEEYARGWNSAIDIINSAPTLSPDDLRPVGKWIEREDMYWGWNIWECSACHEELCIEEGTPKDNGYNYCPNCGAKMEVTDE